MKVEGISFTVEKKQHSDRNGGLFTHRRYRHKVLSDPDALRKCYNIVIERVDERSGWYALTGPMPNCDIAKGWQATRECDAFDEKNGTGKIVGTALTMKALIYQLKKKGIL